MQRWEVIAELIKNKLQNNLGAEIGVWKGETTEYLLNRFKKLKIHCVDPYKIYAHYAKHHTLGKYNTQSAMNTLYGKTRSRLYKFGRRCVWSRKTSVEGAKEVKDNSLDFVFLDANWGYKYIEEDIKTWLPKVRTGGVLIGHRINSNKDSPLCVQRAVEHCFGDDYKLLGGRWYHIKKEDSMAVQRKKLSAHDKKKKTVKKAVKMDRVIRDTLKTLTTKVGRFKAVKTGENLSKQKARYDVVYAEKYLEETQHCNNAMWELIRATVYGGFVAAVVKIGTHKASNFQGVGYFKDRYLPKFGFNIKLLIQTGDTIYFIGQV